MKRIISSFQYWVFKILINNIEQLVKIFGTILVLTFSLFIFFMINAPDDYQQGSMIKMLYIHVPLSIMSIAIYAIMFLMSIITMYYGSKITYLMSISLVKLEVIFISLSIITGSIWGKATWGTYWIWDARLTSMMILFLFIWSQYMLINSVKNKFLVQEVFCVITIIGAINLPIIKFSVYWWNTLHQKSSLLNNSNDMKIDPAFLKPLIYSFSFFTCYALIIFAMELYVNVVNHKALQDKKTKNLKNFI